MRCWKNVSNSNDGGAGVSSTLLILEFNMDPDSYSNIKQALSNEGDSFVLAGLYIQRLHLMKNDSQIRFDQLENEFINLQSTSQNLT